MDTTATTSGILRTLLSLLWLCEFDNVAHGILRILKMWLCCGFEESLLNGRQLVLAVCSLHK